MKKLSALLMCSLALTGCLSQPKEFVCEFSDHSGKTSLVIKGNAATFGKNEYPAKCSPMGNVAVYGAMKDSCRGGLDPKLDSWFLLYFDEVAGTLVLDEKSSAIGTREKYEYICKKAS